MGAELRGGGTRLATRLGKHRVLAIVRRRSRRATVDCALPLAEGGRALIEDQDLAGTLLDDGGTEVVVTRGARGATSYSTAGKLDRTARSTLVVKTTGAGDAFAAGHLSGLLDGLPTEDRLSRAVALGPFAIASPVDWEGLPTRKDLKMLDLEVGSTIR